MIKHMQGWKPFYKQVCLVGVAMLMLAGLGRSQTASPADWTQFHRDNMQRWSPYERMLNANIVGGGLQLKWSFTTGSVVTQAWPQSSPAVVSGVVYIGSADNNVYALNANTGSLIWSYTTGSFVRCSPAVANGVVYVGSYDGNLYALDATTGTKLWSYHTFGRVYSSPTVANGVVYFGSFDGNLYALNASTGVLIWSYPTDWMDSSPAVENGVVYVGVGIGEVYALNATTGDLLWSYVTGEFDSSPAVANGIVYVGSYDGNLYALDASTGAKLWSYLTNGMVESSPAVANGIVYFGAEDYNVYALNAVTGAKLWSYPTAYFAVSSSPAVASGVVYISSDDGTLYVLNATTGAKLWSYATGETVYSSPVVTNGVVYFGTADNTLYAFGLPEVASNGVGVQGTASHNPVRSQSLYTYTFNVTNNGPDPLGSPRLVAQIPYGATFHSHTMSGSVYCVTPAVGTRGQVTCRYQGTQGVGITWTVKLTVWAWSPPGTIITESAAAMVGTQDPKSSNTVTITTNVQ